MRFNSAFKGLILNIFRVILYIYICIILLYNSAEAVVPKGFSWHGRRGICIIKM